MNPITIPRLWTLAAISATVLPIGYMSTRIRPDVGSLAGMTGWIVGSSLSIEYILPIAIACYLVKTARDVFLAIILCVGINAALRLGMPNLGGGGMPWSIFLAMTSIKFSLVIWLALAMKRLLSLHKKPHSLRGDDATNVAGT